MPMLTVCAGCGGVSHIKCNTHHPHPRTKRQANGLYFGILFCKHSVKSCNSFCIKSIKYVWHSNTPKRRLTFSAFENCAVCKILFVVCMLSSKSHNFDWPLARIHKVFVYVGLVVVIVLCSFVSVSLFTKSRVKWTFAIYLPLGINRKSPLTLLNFLCLSVRAESNSKKIVKSLCPFPFSFSLWHNTPLHYFFRLFEFSLPLQSKKDSLFLCEKRQPNVHNLYKVLTCRKSVEITHQAEQTNTNSQDA